MLHVDPHPLLDLQAFITEFPRPLGELNSSPELLALFSLEAETPLSSGDDVRLAVRDLLRQAGFKPTGRSKPAAEYLLRAAGEGKLGSINLAVDACNAVSLHSGLPISVVDLDRVEQPLRVAVAEPGAEYVFNQAGQAIDVARLLCLHDARGPCANAVKDSQRTKTHAGTRRTLSLVWGSGQLAGRSQQTAEWYRELLEAHSSPAGDVRTLPVAFDL